MSRWALAGRLAGSLALGAALGPYDYSNTITGKDTRIALAVVVAPLFLALWLDRETPRKVLATLLLVSGLAAMVLVIFLFFALGDRGAGLWFLIASALIPGTAAFTFGRVAARISVSMKFGVWCALLASAGWIAHGLIFQIVKPVDTTPCKPLMRCFHPHGPLTSELAGLALFLFLFFIVLALFIAICDGIAAVACRIWITRLASGRTLLGQPRRGASHYERQTV